jgi:hypothetical protein
VETVLRVSRRACLSRDPLPAMRTFKETFANSTTALLPLITINLILQLLLSSATTPINGSTAHLRHTTIISSQVLRFSKYSRRSSNPYRPISPMLFSRIQEPQQEEAATPAEGGINFEVQHLCHKPNHVARYHDIKARTVQNPFPLTT